MPVASEGTAVRRPLVLLFKISAAVLVCLLLLGMVFEFFLVEPINRSKCSHDLRAIGECIFEYANDHHGALPPDLGTLAYDEDIYQGVFVCPSSNTSTPQDLPPDKVVAWVNANSDYIYIGAGLKIEPGNAYGLTNGSQIVIAYEKDENHKGKGMNVLFGDGHVEWMTISAAHDAIAKSENENSPPDQANVYSGVSSRP